MAADSFRLTPDLPPQRTADPDRIAGNYVSPKAAGDPGDLPAVTSAPAVQGPSRPAAAVVRSKGGPSEPKVPTTAVTVAQWLQVWMRMCADGELILGPLTDEQRARDVYDFSGRQLRGVRSAALSGSLARRARDLGVELPDGFAETVSERINGHKQEGIAG